MQTERHPDPLAPTSEPRSSRPPAAGADLDGLLSALKRLDGLLARGVEAAERLHGAAGARDPFRGLQITKEDVDRSLARGPGGPMLSSAEDGTVPPCPVTRTHTSRLGWLAATFELSPFDVDVLLIGLAPEIDGRYERFFGYLQDDVTKRQPSVDLLLGLLCPSFGRRLAARERFSPGAPLIAHRLLHLLEFPSYCTSPLLNKYVKVDDRIVAYLLGSDELDARLLPFAEYREPGRALDDVLLSPDVAQQLRTLAGRLGTFGENTALYLHGPDGVGKQSTAEAIGTALGAGLLAIDADRLLRADPQAVTATVDLAFRESRLLGAVTYWKHFDALLGDDKLPWLDAVLAGLARCVGLAVLGGHTAWEPVDALHDRRFVRLELARPGYAERVRLWQAALANGIQAAGDVDPKELANKFRLTGGQIRDVCAMARGASACREPAQEPVTMPDLYAACRRHSSGRLTSLARKVTPHYRWDDIVLPPDRVGQLREICNHVKYRSVVYDEWGFDRKLSLGKGLNVLFAGPSGTGKTMAAEIMAAELGTDLYKIDLSAVVSKYIGETEKNLARVFDDAETSNAILFFDEADALFGKRSEVRDSHDRYANIETSYLLQRMEDYQGIVILATNFRKNMDEAFVRRLHSSVEFPLPDARDRRRIWRYLWPDELPRSPELDLDFLAERCPLPGGNIRNIALAAAFLAADDGGVLTMGHLIRAMRREYQKVGKVVSDGEFGRYANLVDA